MNTWTGRAGLAAVLLLVGIILAINPWIALLLVLAALVKVGLYFHPWTSISKWVHEREIAAAQRRDTAAEGQSRHRTPAVTTARTVITVVLACAAAVSVGVLLFRDPAMYPQGPSVQPSLGVTTNYNGIYTCTDECTRWTAKHDLSVVLSAENSFLMEPLTTRMEDRGWALERSTVQDSGSVIVQFRQSESVRTTPVGWWPLRITTHVNLPAPLGDDGYIFTVTPSRIEDPLSDEDTVRPAVAVYLEFDDESQVALAYPKHTVFATTPASVPASLADDRHERRLLLDRTEDEVTLDLMTPYLRSDGGTRFLQMGLTGWGWVIAAALCSLLFKRVRVVVGSLYKQVVQEIRDKTGPRHAKRAS